MEVGPRSTAGRIQRLFNKKQLTGIRAGGSKTKNSSTVKKKQTKHSQRQKYKVQKTQRQETWLTLSHRHTMEDTTNCRRQKVRPTLGQVIKHQVKLIKGGADNHCGVRVKLDKQKR